MNLQVVKLLQTELSIIDAYEALDAMLIQRSQGDAILVNQKREAANR